MECHTRLFQSVLTANTDMQQSCDSWRRFVTNADAVLTGAWPTSTQMSAADVVRAASITRPLLQLCAVGDGVDTKKIGKLKRDKAQQHSDAMCLVLGRSLTAGGLCHLPRTLLADMLTVAEDVVWQTRAVRLLDQSLDAYWRLSCGWLFSP